MAKIKKTTLKNFITALGKPLKAYFETPEEKPEGRKKT